MVLAQIGIYIFFLVFTLYLAYRALWIVFFLFNFRFWQLIMESFAGDFFSSLTPLQQFLMLLIISIISYTALFFATIRMPLIRYLLLAVLFVAAIRVYSVADILFFKDYLDASGLWGFDSWKKQLTELFSFESGEIAGMFDNAVQVFVDFFMKIIDAVRKM